jgi:hypothetical protein
MCRRITTSRETVRRRKCVSYPLLLETVEGDPFREKPQRKPGGPGQVHEEDEVEAERCRYERPSSSRRSLVAISIDLSLRGELRKRHPAQR